ncbi:right-handed parallel beta-helix repeat-containing protein [Paenibacillus sp. GXUN7292]|uniref:right-handed parallel beta-helix repeat-containing protein n=1 Tax=Paenibacillus sp. GXUN7292 TaxID=3422499 RepID=UPI003D7EA350
MQHKYMKLMAVFMLCLLGAASPPLAAASPEASGISVLQAPMAMLDDAQAASPLQSIVDNANPGDTIILPSGKYEGPVTINKQLTIAGAHKDEVILTSSTDQPVVTILADNVSLQDITIKDERMLPLTAAIEVSSSDNTLENLIILTRGTGIQLIEASRNKLEHLLIEGLRKQSIYGTHDEHSSRKGNGIDLQLSHHNLLANNSISHMFDGIYIEESNNNTVTGNEVTSSRYGYHFMFSDDNELLRNVGMHNVTGAMIMGVKRTIVQENVFYKQAESVTAQGLLLFDAYDSVIERNRIQGNRVGIYVEHAQNNQLRFNDISRNFIGLQLLDASSNNIASNTFIANVIQAQAHKSDGNNVERNYWDDAQNIDLTGSGYSSLPYQVDPFFLTLTEAIPPYQLFFGSPGMQFFESLFAGAGKEQLQDIKPLMKLAELTDDQEAAAPSAVAGAASAFVTAGCLLFIFFAGGRNKR